MTKIQKVSTSDVKQGRFRAHGLVEVTIDGNVARYEAWGPFNEELGTAFNAIQEQVLPEMAALKRWGELTVFHVSMMASASTLAKFTEALRVRAIQGLAPYATAFVAGPEVEGAQLMGSLLAKFYADAGLLLMVFPRVTEAEAWLQSTLSAANPAVHTDAAR